MSSKFLVRNEGSLDRTIRIVVGVGLISLVFVGPETPWGWIGALPLASGLLGTCPGYTLLGIRTCPMETEDKAAG